MRRDSCTLSESDLIALLDGEASPNIAARAAGCPDCQGRLAMLRATRRTLRGATPLRDDRRRQAMLRARLDRAAERERGGWRPWHQATMGRWALPLVLLLLVAAGGDLLGRDALAWPPRCIVRACDLRRPTGDDRALGPSATAMRLEARLNQSRALAWAATTAARRTPGGRTTRGVSLPVWQQRLPSGAGRSTVGARLHMPSCLPLAPRSGSVGRLPTGDHGYRNPDSRAMTWR